MSTLTSDPKLIRQLKRRVKDLEAAILNMRLCPGAAPANGIGPNIGGLCDTCQAAARKLLESKHVK